MSFETKDSGQREEFDTGSRRDTREGKGRFDLIPTMPLRRLAELYERGAVKYGDYNWQKGQPLMRYLDSAQRHINALIAGETTEDHAISAVWNLFSYLWTLEEIQAGYLPAGLDDRPRPEPRYRKGQIADLFKAGISLVDAMAQVGLDPQVLATAELFGTGSAFEADNEHVSETEDCPPHGAEGCGGPGSTCGIHNPVLGSC
jgi:hypothetical protein